MSAEARRAKAKGVPRRIKPVAMIGGLLATKSFARNEGAESGKHMLAVFDRLGIAEEMKAKTKAMPVNTGYVAELVARGEADLAAQQMPELKAVAGIDAMPLPPELQLIIVFSGCVAGAGGARRGQCAGSIPVVARSRFGAAVKGPRPTVIFNPAGTPPRRNASEIISRQRVTA